MENKSCDTCLIKRKGDCFGANSVCEDYKSAPSVSRQEISYWPDVMRSSGLSHKSERKKQEKLNASREKEYKKGKPNSNKNIDHESNYSYAETGYSENAKIQQRNFEKKKIHSQKLGEIPIFQVESIKSIIKENYDKVIIWVYPEKIFGTRYRYYYLLQYGKYCKGEKGLKLYGDCKECLYEGLTKATGRIKADYDKEVLIVYSKSFYSDKPNSYYARLKKQLAMEKYRVDFVIKENLKKEILEHIKNHLEQ